MKSYSSWEIIEILREDGWYFVGCRGNHHFFEHPTKRGKISVPHPRKDTPIKTALSIFKQAGIKI